jgi:hypothetical protein
MPSCCKNTPISLDPTEGPVGQVALSFTHHTIQHGPNDDFIPATHCNSREMAINQTKTTLLATMWGLVVFFTHVLALGSNGHKSMHLVSGKFMMTMIPPNTSETPVNVVWLPAPPLNDIE